MVSDSMAEKVVENILNGSSTGLAGEGKIFVSVVDDAVDIGSKTRGELRFRAVTYEREHYNLSESAIYKYLSTSVK